jgi:hypothetical protein
MDEQTPEAVAYLLFERIAYVEKMEITSPGSAAAKAERKPATREWILDTYAECLEAASGKRTIGEAEVDDTE